MFGTSNLNCRNMVLDSRYKSLEIQSITYFENCQIPATRPSVMRVQYGPDYALYAHYEKSRSEF